MTEHFKFRLSVVLALGGLIIVPLLFWLGGYDFNERGKIAVMCAMGALFASAIGAMVVYIADD